MAAAGIEVEESCSSRWRRALVGPLPADFLRLHNPRDVQEAADCQAAMALHNQQAVPQYVAQNNFVGRLSITCAQAKLARNYGLTRMDPYVRIRVGHYVYETQTDPNGGRNPHWNRVIHSQLPAGVNTIYVEIYDECSFKMDELIAWCEIPIPPKVMHGETDVQSYTLSGKQGEHLEGTIDIVLSFSNQPVQPYMYQMAQSHMLMVPPGRPMPIFVAPQQPHVANTIAPPEQLSEADFKQIHEMFPNIDKEVVKSVFEANRGNKNATINSLLQMNE